MHTSNCWDSIEAGSFPIERLDYRSMISPIVLLDILPLSCKYGISGLLRVILNSMQDHNVLSRLTPERTNIFAWSALQDRVTISLTTSQDMDMFTARTVSFRMVRRRLQQRGLSAWRPLSRLRFSLTLQHREERRLWCSKQESWIQEWHDVVFSEKSRFCMKYFYGCMHVWMLPSDCTPPVCIQYRHRGPASGMMVWAANR